MYPTLPTIQYHCVDPSQADAIGLRDEEGSVKADDNKDGYVDFAEFKADKLRL